jgi:DNA-binding response OmpR family regulator
MITQLPSAAAARKRQVLLAEDEAPIREMIRLHLTLAGHDVTECVDGSRALDLARTFRFDLIVLDLTLPGVDGIALCRALRTQGSSQGAAILMLAARETESDKVTGLESGADDYVTKPFGMREFIARVGAVLRRHDRMEEVPASSFRQVRGGDVMLDLDKRHAIVRGTRVELTKQEFELLHLLTTRPGIVFSREALLARVWGSETYVTERTVDKVVSRLRRKIEANGPAPGLILTAWGVGYKFADLE